jgi:tetratricopeptide (TPR) repeat protein
MLAVEDNTIQNQHNLQRLIVSVRASYGKLNLLIAVCDNRKYRDQLINSYEIELQAQGARCHRIRIDRQQFSLKQSLQDLAAREPELKSSNMPALITVLGADELLGIRLNQPKSDQEQFFFSLQWTREALREFKVPILLWLTPAIATALAQQAPDFWSWRGGVFEFSLPLSSTLPLERSTREPITGNPSQTVTDPIALQQQIDELQAQAPDSPLLASLYNSLGNAYKDAIRYTEAEVPYRKALELYEKVDHPDVASSINNLAELYRSQGRYEEAEPLYIQALSLNQELLGESHPSVATSINNLAALYDSQGRYEEAEPLYKQALSLRQELLGDRHPSVATSINNLAELYRSQGRYEEAEPLYKQALSLRQELLGDRHPSVATSINNLALLYDSQGRYEEAEPLYIQALSLNQELLGDRHPNVASSINNLAALYYAQGRYEEAEPLYKQALSLRQELLGGGTHPEGNRHPDVATSLFNLAVLYHNMQRHSEAMTLIQRAIQIYEQTLGINHPNTQTAQSWLQSIHAALNSNIDRT